MICLQGVRARVGLNLRRHTRESWLSREELAEALGVDIEVRVR